MLNTDRPLLAVARTVLVLTQHRATCSEGSLNQQHNLTEIYIFHPARCA
jgi:hypothetical protein